MGLREYSQIDSLIGMSQRVDCHVGTQYDLRCSNQSTLASISTRNYCSYVKLKDLSSAIFAMF